MAEIQLKKTTYGSEDEIDIQINFSNSPQALENVTNINIDIFRVDIERNNFVFGFGAKPPEGSLVANIKQKLPNNFQEGLYVVSGIKLIYGEDGHDKRNVEIEDSRKRFFWFSNNETLAEKDIYRKITEFEVSRQQYVNSEIKTTAALGSDQCKQYKVIIFGVGCLLHSLQLMKGYVLYPLGLGYSYDHMLSAVNDFTQKKYGFHLDRVESIESSFASSTPLFAVEFNNIRALNHSDAGSHCGYFSENIFTILAYDRGQRPRTFATIIVDVKTSEIWQSFHFPGYRGNLISDFNPSSTANTLQRLLHRIERSPWVDLILRIYADAKTETNRDYACFKYWQILEMIAKKHVSDNTIEVSRPDGTPIEDAIGKAVTTKYALGKVYKYLFDREGGLSVRHSNGSEKIIFESSEDARANPNFDANTTVISLWDTLSALYQIRNATAHSGKFNVDIASSGGLRERKAVELLSLSHGAFIDYVSGILMSVVSTEINNA